MKQILQLLCVFLMPLLLMTSIINIINLTHSSEMKVLVSRRSSLKDPLTIVKYSCRIEYTTQHTWIPSKPISTKIKVNIENNTRVTLTIVLIFKHGGFRVK